MTNSITMKRLYLLLLLLPTLLTAQDFADIKDSLKNKYDYIGYRQKFGIVEARTKQQTYTLLNAKGEELFPPKYAYIHITPEGFFEAGLKMGKTMKRGYINKDGSVRVPIIYDNVYMPSDNTIRVTQNNKTGIVDTLGNTVIPINFDSVDEADKGYYFATNKGLSALYHNNKTLTDFNIKHYTNYTDNRVGVLYTNNTATIIDDTGKPLFTPVNANIVITRIFSGYALAEDQFSGKVGIIDFDGSLKIPCKYNDIEPAGNNLIVTLGRKKGLVDLAGKEIIPLIYQNLVYYKKPGVFWAMLNNKEQQILDANNNSIIPGTYKNLYIYQDTYIIAEQTDGITGIYNTIGKVITTPQYSFFSLYNNHASVTKAGKCYTITIDGSAPPKPIEVADSFKVNFTYYYDQNGYVIFKKGKLYGLTTIDGNIIVPAQYTDMEYIYSSPEFIVQKNSKYGIINTEGETIEPIIFDSFQLRKETVLLKKAGKKDVFHEVVFKTNLKDFREAK